MRKQLTLDEAKEQFLKGTIILLNSREIAPDGSPGLKEPCQHM